MWKYDNRFTLSRRYKEFEKNIIEKMHVMWGRLIACLQQKRFSPTLNYPLARRQECG